MFMKVYEIIKSLIQKKLYKYEKYNRILLQYDLRPNTQKILFFVSYINLVS